jgi:hypothetical protein|tara:strand:- start:67 stop:1104 length:1038 start_codon:yes stop_codon:yes gene_type:complete
MAYTTINKSTDYFNTKLYTGTGSENAISGVGFQPDWIWLKKRTESSHHFLQDAVRGATYQIKSSTNDAQANYSQYVKSIQSDGFTLGTDTDVNKNTIPAVSWNWKAGTTGSGTTGGSGTAKAYSYSVNTTAGFSIVKYAGNGSAGHTIPHHLGAVPKVIMVKDLTDNEAWRVYHAGVGFPKWLILNTSAAETNDSSVFDNVPTSSGFLVGSANPVNNATHEYIAYCFAEKTGYSRFDSYTGNGNADGTFVYTGFKPAWVLTKEKSGTSSWDIHDNKRDTHNVCEKYLLAEDTGAEGSTVMLDFLSNGFKFRSSNGDRNQSGASYIYMAFAEAPLVGSNGITAKAR